MLYYQNDSISLTFKTCPFNDLFTLWAVANLMSPDYFTFSCSSRPCTLFRAIAGLKETKIHLNNKQQQNKQDYSYSIGYVEHNIQLLIISYFYNILHIIQSIHRCKYRVLAFRFCIFCSFVHLSFQYTADLLHMVRVRRAHLVSKTKNLT